MEVANTYTYSQAMAITDFLIRDKFAVVAELLHHFQSATGKQPSTPASTPLRTGNKMPSWYKPKPGAKIYDLDGPLSALQPFLGKDKLSHRVKTPARRKK